MTTTAPPPTETPVVFTAMVVGNADFQSRAANWLRSSGAVRIICAASVRQARAWPRVTPARGGIVLTQLQLPDGPCIPILGELQRAGWTAIVAAPAWRAKTAVTGALEADAKACVLYGSGRWRPNRQHAIAALGLSEREAELLQEMAWGAGSNRNIARRLQLSHLTVKSHLARIGVKLNTGDRAQMVARAWRAGAIS